MISFFSSSQALVISGSGGRALPRPLIPHIYTRPSAPCLDLRLCGGLPYTAVGLPAVNSAPAAICPSASVSSNTTSQLNCYPGRAGRGISISLPIPTPSSLRIPRDLQITRPPPYRHLPAFFSDRKPISHGFEQHTRYVSVTDRALTTHTTLHFRSPPSIPAAAEL